MLQSLVLAMTAFRNEKWRRLILVDSVYLPLLLLDKTNGLGSFVVVVYKSLLFCGYKRMSLQKQEADMALQNCLFAPMYYLFVTTTGGRFGVTELSFFALMYYLFATTGGRLGVTIRPVCFWQQKADMASQNFLSGPDLFVTTKLMLFL